MKLVVEQRALSLLATVSAYLSEQKIEAYLVGGLVRDALLGRDTADIDVVVAGDALEVAPGIAAALGGKYVLLDEESGLGRVILADGVARPARGQWEIDFSTMLEGIEQDLARRDFTVDAMAVDLERLVADPADVELIDPFGGRDDLGRGIIRAVAGGVFEADAARLLRAVRLAAELGFGIEPETESIIKRCARLIADVAGERVREELLRLLVFSQAGHFLRYLDRLGLLTALIPELTPARGFEQPKEHFWDVFDHSIETVVAVDFLLRRGPCEYAGEEVLEVVPWSAELAEYFEQGVSGGSTRGQLLKLAALLHDVAKPQTRTFEAGGRMRFLGHADKGAEIAAGVLARLRFSNREIRLVETEVKHHLRPVQMSHDGLPTPRAIYRYFRDTGEAGIDVLFLSLADHLAARGAKLELGEWREHAGVVEHVMAQHFKEESLVLPLKLVDGHDLIDVFGIRPGPEIGRLLEAVREAQAAGELATRQQALSYIHDCLLAEGCK